jgi:D-arabinose 1-dehydrogenase-like Zn-dependent alcohol dehydrogenase
VQAVVAALDLDTPWLVGHSIGGIIATQLPPSRGLAVGWSISMGWVSVSRQSCPVLIRLASVRNCRP